MPLKTDLINVRAFLRGGENSRARNCRESSRSSRCPSASCRYRRHHRRASPLPRPEALSGTRKKTVRTADRCGRAAGQRQNIDSVSMVFTQFHKVCRQIGNLLKSAEVPVTLICTLVDCPTDCALSFYFTGHCTRSWKRGCQGIIGIKIARYRQTFRGWGGE
jgi:hypothetical protein